jgi:predicted Fe-Mo cluster-binding NifX family protein
MYARRLANEIIVRPGDEPDERYDARPTRPASTNERALRAWDALSTTTTTTTTTKGGGTSRARGDGAMDASVVLRAMAVMPSEETIAARRRPRLDPWTARALRDDVEGDGGARKRGRGGGRKGGATSSSAAKKSDDAKASEAVERLRAVAREALESTKEATRLKAEANARFMETRNFAGKIVEVETEFVEGTKEAKAHTKRLEMLAKGGIDAVLAELMQPKKLTVLDKTKADWRNVKDGDADLQEDLQHHQRGGRTYREQQDFLQQADFREYELERDARLAANSKRGGAR